MKPILVALALVLTAHAAAAEDPDPIVLGSCNVTKAVGWTNPADCALPLSTPDAGLQWLDKPVAAPTQYFEQTFTASAGSYHVWVRMRALNNSKWNDAVWLQFSDAVTNNGQALFRIGTTTGLAVNLATDSSAGSLNGWGWQDGAYWLNQTATIKFAASGTHTIRVQTREDGVLIDQIILSRALYLTTSPGLLTNDQTRFSSLAAPAAVSVPVPAAAATNLPVTTALSWAASANATGYDVFFGAVSAPPSVSSNQTAVTYQPALLAANTTYFWRVDARNAGGTTAGPLWSFTTAAAALPPVPAPGVPTALSPTAGATNVAVTTALSWAAANATSYDVSFGTTNPPPMAAANLTTTSYQPAALTASATYYWRIDAHGAGGTTTGPVWSFTTAAPATPAPAVPSGPMPANGNTAALAGSALNWAPSANATSYDVYFGTSATPALVASALTGTSYQPATATSPSTTYYWKVVAIGVGGQTAGPIWTFTTSAPVAPPTGDSPSTGNTVVNRLRVFNWNVAQGYNPVGNTNDYNLQLDMIASVKPDVVTLQEVSFSDADMMAIYIDGLAKRTGKAWRGYYQRDNMETAPTTNNLGSAILTWLPVDAHAETLLLDDPTHPFAALQIQVTVNGTPVHVSTTHLYAWDTAVRSRQLAAFHSWLSTQGGRRIVSGDFNANPLDATTWIAAWTRDYTDAWVTATSWVQPTGDGGYTFDKRTATGKPERIDYQFTKGVTVSEMFVMKTRRSDHHAVVGDYAVP